MLQIKPHTKDSWEHKENANFNHPIELLMSCHEKMLHFSSALVELSIALKKEGWTDTLITSASQIRRYFKIATPEHHLDEETHLFPALIALDPEFQQTESIKILQLINELIKEHVESDALWKTLDSMLEEQSKDYDDLKELSLEFKLTTQEHIRIENEQIFSYAKTHISTIDLQNIGQAIAERRGISLSLSSSQENKPG